ncbi:MAG: tRNA 2-thiouridine(34) synthase MnmA [Candidatus Azambacteria bacterium]|nr:tRNA 2-thiouridine(34) synthase MnmA [Candidatus Azambacteria bacterium]
MTISYMKKIRQKKKKKIGLERGRRVFVGMSGGVDSSVAAALLKKQGYDVVGVFIKGWSDNRFFKDKTMCPWITDQEDARRVAAALDIPFYTFDFEKEYRTKVVEYMVKAYRAGITPNPDVMCNKEIKFGVFFDKARKLGADFVATGHHARVTRRAGIARLCTGKDAQKDQSYFLWTLTQKQLMHTLMPVGEYTKGKVREMARTFGLPTAEKKDSQGLCFVGEVNVHDFLKSMIKPKKGKIITTSGKTVGEHEGAMFYTIGQRHGIGSPGGGTPYYVAGKDMKKNILYVSEGVGDAELYKKEMDVIGCNWVSGKAPKFPVACKARIRYRQPLEACKIVKKGRNTHVVSHRPQRAVAPGQSIVFYKRNVVIGGGVIV